MGADLYRDDFEHLYGGPRQAEWEAAVARRDEVCPGHTLYTDEAEQTPEVVACREAQADVARIHEETYGHPKYFRDSYNDSSLFWKLDMSWWNDLQDYVGPNGDGAMETFVETWTDEDGVEQTETYEAFVLHPPGMAKLHRRLRDLAETLAYNVRDLPDTSEETWETKSYFFGKFDKLLDFLQQAADGGHTIRCSV